MLAEAPMMSGQTIARIEKLENGYVVEVCDPKVVAKNREPKSSYEDPWKGHALATVDDVKEFLGKHLDSLSPPPSADEEYKHAFKAASTKK
jgi:hypothetical protein